MPTLLDSKCKPLLCSPQAPIDMDTSANADRTARKATPAKSNASSCTTQAVLSLNDSGMQAIADKLHQLIRRGMPPRTSRQRSYKQGPP